MWFMCSAYCHQIGLLNIISSEAKYWGCKVLGWLNFTFLFIHIHHAHSHFHFLMHLFSNTNGVDAENLPVFSSLLGPFISNFSFIQINLFLSLLNVTAGIWTNQSFTTITSWIIGHLMYLFLYVCSLWRFFVTKHQDIYMPRNLLYPARLYFCSQEI